MKANEQPNLAKRTKTPMTRPLALYRKISMRPPALARMNATKKAILIPNTLETIPEAECPVSDAKTERLVLMKMLPGMYFK